MVSEKFYKGKTNKEWINTKVRTNRVLRNGVIEIPIGTVCTITDKFGGFALKTNPCKKCGVRVYITKVGYDDVDVVSDEVKRE